MWGVWKGDESDGANGQAFGNALLSGHDFAISVFDFRFGGGIDGGVNDLITKSIEVLITEAVHTQWHALGSSESNSLSNGTPCSSTKTCSLTSIASRKVFGILSGCWDGLRLRS